MRYGIRLIARAVILLCIVITKTMATKRKMCVEFSILNSRWNRTVLKSIPGVRKSDCLIRCAHNPSCNAYNWIHTNGTCELPALGDCPGESMEEEDSTFVHLADCTGHMPLVVARRNWSVDATCLAWRRVDAVRGVDSCAGDIQRSSSHKACASIIHSKGTYLPGWYINREVFRTVTEDVKPLLCSGKGVGYLLRVAPGCPTDWVWYNVGEPIPTTAVQVSTWKDGTPLYFVTATDPPRAFGTWAICYPLSHRPSFIHGIYTALQQ